MVQSDFTHVGGPGIFSPFLWSHGTNLHRCLARYSWAHHGPQLRNDLVPESCSKVANMYWGSSVVRVPACLPQRGSPVRFLARKTGGLFAVKKNTHAARILIKIRLPMQIRIRIEKGLGYDSGSAFSHTSLLVMKRSIKWVPVPVPVPIYKTVLKDIFQFSPLKKR